MATFRFQHGDRPLDGFTVQHALGRGGFGEVYYALSDSGREVALKLVQNYEDVELRGIRQCMNLKSPHLVSIFDLRHNRDNLPFVIMEYVSGPSLRELLDASPEGLGTDKAAFFLREIAKGLSYLHDCGIVHRDLKPHNIFYEEGFVKIGDYSLSKAITASHRSGHTLTVGTIHYMAPEISFGRYDHLVDVYSLGVILYEMLTGKPPFEGSSVGEVLMKHASGEVDLSGIAEPFASVIRRALAKDPEHRYQSAQEMVEAVFGAESIQDSVATFNPASLSFVADRFSRKAEPSSRAPYRDEPAPAPEPEAEEIPANVRNFARHITDAFFQFRKAAGVTYDRPPSPPNQVRDPLPFISRAVSSIGVVAMSALFTTVLVFGHPKDDGILFFFIMMMQFGALILARRFLWPFAESGVTSRIFLGGPAAVVACFPGAVMWDELHRLGPHEMVFAFASAAGLLTLDLRCLTETTRQQRLQLLPVFFAAVVTMIFAFMINEHSAFPAPSLVVAGTLLGIQFWSPYQMPEYHGRKHHGWLASLYLAIQSLWRGRPSTGRAEGVNHTEAFATSMGTPVSPKSRETALWLSTICPMFLCAGVQRLYVGKFKSGLLWLLTLGLAGVGQLFDIIMIALGNFRDKTGRRVLIWNKKRQTTVPRDEPVNHYSSVPKAPKLTGDYRLRVGNLITSMLGGVCLFSALLFGGVVASEFPDAVAAGLFDAIPVLEPNNLDYAFGWPGWPRLVYRASFLAASFCGILAFALLTFSRRGYGLLHIGRVVVSGACFIACLSFMHMGVFRIRWTETVASLRDHGYFYLMDQVLERHDAIPGFLFAGIVGTAGILILAWPARRPTVKPQTEAIESRSERQRVAEPMQA